MELRDDGKLKPEYFVMDFSEAENNAITATFQYPIYICKVHQKQACQRWVKQKENCPNENDKNILLQCFSMKKRKFKSFVYQRCFYKPNINVQRYFS